MAGSSIKVSILGDASPLEEAFARAEEATKGFAVVAAAALGGMGLVIDKSVKAALSAGAATQQMGQAFRNAGLNAKDYAAQIDQAEASGRQLGFTNTETEGALKRLITATGSVSSAMKDLGVAQDLARYQGISLESATQRVGSALVGNQVAVKQLGVTIPPVTEHVQALRSAHYDLTTAAGQAALAHARLQDKLATGEAIMAAVDAKTKGMAGTFSSTAAGGMAAFSAQFDALEVSIGNVFLPVLGRVANALGDFIGKINDAKGFDAKMQLVFAGISKVAEGAWTRLKAAFNAIDWSAVWSVVETGMAKGIDLVNAAFASLPRVAADVYAKLKAGFDAIDWGSVWAHLQQLWSTEIATFSKFGSEAASAIQSSFQGVNWKAVFQSASNGLDQFGKDAGKAILDGLNKLSDYVKQVDWPKVGQALVVGIEAAIVLLAKFIISTGPIKILEAFNTLSLKLVVAVGGVLYGMGTTLAKQLLDGIGKGLDKLGSVIEKALGGLASGIENAAQGAWLGIEKGALDAALYILKTLDFKVFGHAIIPGVDSMVKGIEGELAKLDVKTPLVNAINSSATAVGQAGHGIGQVLANGIIAGVTSTAANAGASSSHGGGGGFQQPAVKVTGTGSTTDVSGFITDLIKSFGGNPNSASSRDALATWQRMEGGSTNNPDAYNFLNTKLPYDGSHGSIGSQGNAIQVYKSFQDGLNATVQTLQHGYPAIIHAIATGDWSPTPELAKELKTWSGGGYSAILGAGGSTNTAGATYGPAGSTTDVSNLTVKTKKAKAVPTYKLPPELEKGIKDAQATFNTAITEYQKTMSDDALTNVEQTVTAMQKELAAASALASGKKGGTALIDSLSQKLKAAQDKLIAAVQTANDKIITAVTKQADADDKAAQSDATKAASAFGKGQFSAAESYTRAQIASLTAAQSALQKVISTTLRGSDDAAQKAARAEFEKVTGELADEGGAVKWIQSVGKIMADFNTQMKAETTKLASDTQQRSAEAALQSVGYFAASAAQVTGLDQVLLGDAQNEASTITTHIQQLEAQVKAAPKNLQAGLNQQIAKLQSQLSSVNSQIVSDMGTVQSDLVSALQQAQQTFSTAISNLQTSLDSQLTQGAQDASGYTSDNAQLQSMQAADQLGGLTDALSKAQDTLTTDSATYSQQLDSNNADNVNSLNDAVNAAKTKLDTDKKANASQSQLVLDQNDLTKATKALTDSINASGGVTQDQITTDQAAVKSAQRALDEYNLQIKAQGEQATATKNAADATADVNGKLADWSSDLASGKIDLKTFQADIAGLSDYVKNKYGVNIDLSSAQFANVTAAAAGVVGAFSKLIDWINQTTGSSLPGGTQPPSGGAGSSVPSGGQTPPDVGNTAGGSSTGPGAQNVGGGGSTPIPVAVVSVPPPTSTPVSGLTGHGPQLMAGGIVKALQGVVVPGLPRSGDYVPAMLNGGEMVLNEMQQSRLFAILNGRGGGGAWAQPGPIVRGRSYEAPPIVINLPNYVGDKRELMQVINDQLKRSYANGA